jgi:hypothetical protein
MLRRPFRLLPLLAATWSVGCATGPHPAITAAVAAVDSERVFAHVEALCHIGPRPECNREATEATLQYLEARLAEAGYAPRREPFEALMLDWVRLPHDGSKQRWQRMAKRGVTHHNLIAEKAGSGPAAATVIELGAHYDSMPWAPGADDNASGVAVVLETARLLATRPTDKTVRFVFYAMEEEGLVGSAAHVKQLIERQDLPEAALVLDMVGFASDAEDSQDSPVRIPLVAWVPYTANFILDAGDFSSGWLGNLFEDSAATYVPELPVFSVNRLAGLFEDAARSDHASYWAAGLDAILLSDTAEMRNRHYHTPTDQPATLDRTFLKRNAAAVLATMLAWAGPVDS